MEDYTGQTIFIGIDVHKKTYSVTALCSGRVVKRDTIIACPNYLISYCRKFFLGGTVFSAYEAGFCGFHLHRKLHLEGIHNIVVHPSSIEVASRDRVKTDKRDSLKIATQLSVGRLKCVHIPSEKQEAFRSISRLREQFVRDKTRVAVQLKSLMNVHGLSSYKDNRRVSRKWIAQLASLSDESEICFSIKMLAKRWQTIDLEISIIDEKLKQQAKEDYILERVYRSAPGIGPVISRVLINELGDMAQFKNERAIFSYTGLTPQEYSSGEHTRQGHISRQGRSVLRKTLVQAAWQAVKKDEVLKDMFEKIAKRAGKKRAIVAIARKLIGHIRSCIGKNEEYGYIRR